MSQLNEEQTAALRQWIDEGESLPRIQTRLDEEFAVKLTYMELRFLVEDLDLTLKENTPSAKEPVVEPIVEAEPEFDGTVAVSLDAVTVPGTIVSGSVTFSDGQTAAWQLDQMGRIGLVPATEGYRPSQADLAEFQLQLENELRKKGF